MLKISPSLHLVSLDPMLERITRLLDDLLQPHHNSFLSFLELKLRKIALDCLLPFRTQLLDNCVCIHVCSGHGNQPLCALNDFLRCLALHRFRLQCQRDRAEYVLSLYDDSRILSRRIC